MSVPSVAARIGEIESLLHGTGGQPAALRQMAWSASSIASLAAPGASTQPGGIVTSGQTNGRHPFVDVLDAAAVRQANGSDQWAASVYGAPRATPVATSDVSASARFVSPLAGATLTQAYGPTDFSLEPPLTVNGVRYAHFHAGIDLARPLGSPIVAAAAGTVIAAGRASDGAVIVRIRHADGSETLYGHMQPALSVKTGDQVSAGQQIGTVGMTGNTTGPHLHFALYAKDGTPMDPQVWLDAGRLPGQVPGAVSGSAAGATGGAVGVASAQSVAGADGSRAWQCTQQALATFDAVSAHIPYASAIRSAAVAAGIDPLLLASVVKAESAFQPGAVSSVGAMGLMQLMPATAASLGVTDPFDPAQSLNGGARYLASQLNRFGRVDLALAAYQAGPTLVARLGGIPDYPSTRGYIRVILASWNSYAESAS